MYVISAHQRYRRTDGRTDGRTSSDGITAPLLKAWSGKNHAGSRKMQQMNPLTNFLSSATTHVDRDCLGVTISVISLCSFMLIYQNHPQHIIVDVISKYVTKQATNQQPNVIILISRENTTRIHMRLYNTSYTISTKMSRYKLIFR